MSCNNNCDQGRRCDCIDFLTPAERRRFWITLAAFLAADVAVIAFVLWAL